jgi:hypothetical protein
MFTKAARSRDTWLGKKVTGVRSETTQKYYTGMTLPQYLYLVFLEYPLAVVTSLVGWLAGPVVLVYMLARITTLLDADQLGLGLALKFGFLWSVMTLLVVILLFFVWVGVTYWAEQGPNVLTQFYLKYFGNSHEDARSTPEKFPGPVALLKKWILALDEGEVSRITWDSGKSRNGGLD